VVSLEPMRSIVGANLLGRPRTAFRCRQGTVSVKELPIRVHHFQVRLDLALKLCLQLVLDLLHYCERPLLQLINGEEVSNETAPQRCAESSNVFPRQAKALATTNSIQLRSIWAG
jgi:hypothetical protein